MLGLGQNNALSYYYHIDSCSSSLLTIFSVILAFLCQFISMFYWLLVSTFLAFHYRITCVPHFHLWNLRVGGLLTNTAALPAILSLLLYWTYFSVSLIFRTHIPSKKCQILPPGLHHLLSPEQSGHLKF